MPAAGVVRSVAVMAYLLNLIFQLTDK